jgi:hypothetical protein
MEDSSMRSLGGLVKNTKVSGNPKKEVMSSSAAPQTEFHIIGHASRTHVPGEHMGQVPYPGHYRSAMGARLS